MFNFKSLVVVVAMVTLATMSIAQAAQRDARKPVRQPNAMSATVRGAHAEMPGSPTVFEARRPTDSRRRPGEANSVCVQSPYALFRVYVAAPESAIVGRQLTPD